MQNLKSLLKKVKNFFFNSTFLEEKSELSTLIIFTTFFLVSLGLLAIYASSSITAGQRFGDSFLFVKKQLFSAFLGLMLVLIIQKLSFSWIKHITWPIFILTLCFLILVFIPPFTGKAGKFSRWIDFGVIRFQPAELAKLAVLCFLAKSLTLSRSNLQDFWRGIAPNILVVSVFCGLIMLQPDFGSTVHIILVSFTLFFVAGIATRFIIVGSFALVCLLTTAVLIAPYRLARVTTFMDPWTKIKDGGYQIIQSYLAFSNGGLVGQGLGESKQKLYFLPEAHTDFILSVIGEELGLFGVALVILLFSFLVFLGFKTAMKQSDQYFRFLSFGITAAFALQAIMNIGVATGFFPTKGIPLPFVSHGSSSLLVFLTMSGILAKLAKLRGESQKYEPKGY